MAGLSKPNVVEGVEMFLGHRKAYTDPNFNTWAATRDPRYRAARDVVMTNDWPVAKEITYFGNGRWAEDSTGYGQKVIAKFKAMQSWKAGK